MNVLITGASGFVGRALVRFLAGRPDFSVTAVSRTAVSDFPDHVRFVCVREALSDHRWRELLAKQDAIVHLAARVHVMREHAANPLAEFRRANVDGTLEMARRAIEVGVGRFVFMSSIKVNGEHTPTDRPFSNSDPALPKDAYAVSKFEAEEALRDIGRKSGLKIVIVRPPLVYGPGVAGNFLRMLNLIDGSFVIPCPSSENRRSLISLSNLIDFVTVCVQQPSVPDQPLLVSDGEDLSTADLFRRVARLMGRERHVLGIPESLLRAIGTLLGKRSEMARLCESLAVNLDDSKLVLGWRPKYSVDQGLAEVVNWYRTHKRS